MASRLRIAVPLVLVAAGAVWWYVGASAPTAEPGSEPATPASSDTARSEHGTTRAVPDAPPAVGGAGASDADAIPTRSETTSTIDEPAAGDAAQVRGRVVDDGGRPIAGATVELLRVTGSVLAVTESIGATTRTSGAGGYAFAVVPLDAAFVVRASAAGFAQARVDALTPTAGKTIVVRDLVLVNGIVVTGRVEDAERGTPVPNALVTVQLVRGGVLADPLGTGSKTVSDSSGRYRADGLLPETYRFAVVADGYVDTRQDRSFFAARTRKDVALDFALLPSAGDVAGMAQDAAGAPVADASITATAMREQATPHVVVAESRADGTFELRRLGPWTYRVDAIAAHRCIAQTVELRATDGSLTLVFVNKARIEGKVVFEGGAGSARVDASAAPSDGTSPKLFSQTPAAADGSFVIEDVPTGAVVLDVASDIAAPTRFGPFAVGAGAHLDGIELRVARGALARGRVLRSDGSPAAFANVVLVPSDFDVARTDAALILLEGTSKKNTRCDANGAFVLEGLPEGSYRVRAELAGFSAAWSKTFSTTEHADTKVGVLALAAACTIEGVVTDATGNAVAQAIVRAQSPSGIAGGVTASDGIGRFRFDALAPGEWIVTAVKQNPKYGALDETAAATITAAPGAAARVQLAVRRKE